MGPAAAAEVEVAAGGGCAVGGVGMVGAATKASCEKAA